MQGARLQAANLQGARLQAAVLSGVQLQGAECDAGTVWPDGFDWKAAGILLLEAEVIPERSKDSRGRRPAGRLPTNQPPQQGS